MRRIPTPLQAVRCTCRVVVTSLLVLALRARVVRAAEASASASSATTIPAVESKDARAPGPWGFTTTLATGGVGGDFGNLFIRPATWDYSFFRQKGVWRAGLGMTFGSFRMQEPYQHEPEWGFQQVYLFGTRVFHPGQAVQPYILARAGIARLRPRSTLFKIDPLPPNWESGQHIIEKTDGFSIGLAPGLEYKVTRAAYADVSASFTYFNVSDYDLSPVGQPPRSQGTVWEGRLGLTWFPNGDRQGEGEQGGRRDPWGVRSSYGWAAGEVLAINNLAGVAAQYVRDVDWSETSPRSWWENIKTGFQYDPDTFKTNQWTHPFNGAAYYNSSRANGLGYWPSTGFALGGAFEWECCGETQAMSFNDMFSTVIGGISLGEAQYRLSSEILDNQAQGTGRFWREFGAFFVDPVREFNRLVSGDANRVMENPSDPMDWRPKAARTFVATGVRSIGEGASLAHDTQTYATILLNHSHGDVFANQRRGPFDYVDFIAELNFGAKVALSNVQIRGDLASWPLGGPSADHVFALVQHFDYQNNTAYLFGGQSVAASLSSRFRTSNRAGVTTRLDGEVILLGAVNSEYSQLADVANPERLREYDYGPGLGTTARADLLISGRPLLSALYRFTWISVTNGSVYEKGSYGLDANHYLQSAGLRLDVPVKRQLGIGADAFYFLRNSDFTVTNSVTGREGIQHIRQRNPQLRFYLSTNRMR